MLKACAEMGVLLPRRAFRGPGGQWIYRRMRETFGIADWASKNISLIVFQPEHIVETATKLGRERRR